MPNPGFRTRVFRWLGACLAAAVVAVAVAALLLKPLPAVAAPGPNPPASAATVVGRTTTGQIAAYVQRQAQADHIPGTAVAVTVGRQPVLLRGYGNATADTPFLLGSLSKSFTALAVMQLADQGKVRLDSPVRAYIPWFKIGDGRQSAAITVRQLLDQTSGISGKAGLTELSFAPDTTFPQAIKGFEAFPLATAPGTAFQYSDANYTIAGYVVQQVSGQSYDSYLRQHVFAPLGMTHSYAETGPARAPGLTRGNADYFGVHVPLTEQVAAPLVPAGYVISSAADLTHYLLAQLDGGVYHGTRIVSAQAVREMHAALVPVGAQAPVPGASAYGLGWGTGTVNGVPVIVHDGQLRDYDTAMALLPRQQVTVAVLMNQDPQLVVNDDQLYNGILQGITTGTFPGVSQAYPLFYAVFDVIALATLILMTVSLARTGRWRRKFRARAAGIRAWPLAVRAAALDLLTAAAVAAAVVYGLGAVTGYVPLTPTLMLFAAPDVALWCYAVAGFFAVRAVVRAAAVTADRVRRPAAEPRLT